MFAVVATATSIATASWVFVRCNTRQPSRGDDIANIDGLPKIDMALCGITNDITREFHVEDRFRSHLSACAFQTLQKVKSMTGKESRLTVARHLAEEVLHINLKNENYHFRNFALCDIVNCIIYCCECLEIAEAREYERCKFVFDGLQLAKDGYLYTLSEPYMKPIRPLDKGVRLLAAQLTCKKGSQTDMRTLPGYLVNRKFRFMYPKLSPEGKEYFKKRFREVFGIGYIPNEPRKPVYLEGLEGTRWDGSGLKWQIRDEKGNWSCIEND